MQDLVGGDNDRAQLFFGALITAESLEVSVISSFVYMEDCQRVYALQLYLSVLWIVFTFLR